MGDGEQDSTPGYNYDAQSGSYHSDRSDGVRDRSHAGRGSGGDAVRRRDEQRALPTALPDGARDPQNDRSLDLPENDLNDRQQPNVNMRHIFCPGKQICLAGLHSAQMNGKTGYIVPTLAPPPPGRANVRLDHVGVEYKIKFENLTLLTADGFLD